MQKTFLWPVFLKNKKGENFPFLAKKHGLTPLENCKILDFLKSMLLECKMASFILI